MSIKKIRKKFLQYNKDNGGDEIKIRIFLELININVKSISFNVTGNYYYNLNYREKDVIKQKVGPF